ncbi:MAG: alpha-L-rhamnosidase [Acidobacteriaceae bacterium]|nr:alpha-L-rhamnosidase [Acidobacteriaceae bacterium]
MITRRQMFRACAAAPACLFAREETEQPQLSLGNERLDATYRAAIETLRRNMHTVANFPRPVLFEGAEYGGVWLECAPLEGLVYEPLSPPVACNNHDIFFNLQREDGYLPYAVKTDRIGSSQIQMAVPIAATAFELYRRNRDAAFLERAYAAAKYWDAWLLRYRNTRGTGLCEAFCAYDTGQDGSPRFAGKPNRCREGDARLCPNVPGLPYLAPDLSASVYGGRIALAAIAREMGREREASLWLEAAERVRRAILERLYDTQDCAFYDRDASDRFVRIRSVAILRVLGEHVPDQPLFEQIYRAQIKNEHAFWAPYPFPSIALNDRAFVRPIPRNSWGGASQALTALRAPRWMEHYGKYADFTHLMKRWTEALARAGGFLQQVDPESGEFTPAQRGYSPAALVFFDFAWRLYGVRWQGDEFEWNCRLPADSKLCVSRVKSAELRTNETSSRLFFHGKCIAEVKGEARLITSSDGRALRLVGTAPAAARVVLRHSGSEREYLLRSDQTLQIHA